MSKICCTEQALALARSHWVANSVRSIGSWVLKARVRNSEIEQMGASTGLGKVARRVVWACTGVPPNVATHTKNTSALPQAQKLLLCRELDKRMVSLGVEGLLGTGEV